MAANRHGRDNITTGRGVFSTGGENRPGRGLPQARRRASNPLRAALAATGRDNQRPMAGVAQARPDFAAALARPIGAGIGAGALEGRAGAGTPQAADRRTIPRRRPRNPSERAPNPSRVGRRTMGRGNLAAALTDDGRGARARALPRLKSSARARRDARNGHFFAKAFSFAKAER